MSDVCVCDCVGYSLSIVFNTSPVNSQRVSCVWIACGWQSPFKRNQVSLMKFESSRIVLPW